MCHSENLKSVSLKNKKGKRWEGGSREGWRIGGKVSLCFSNCIFKAPEICSNTLLVEFLNLVNGKTLLASCNGLFSASFVEIVVPELRIAGHAGQSFSR